MHAIEVEHTQSGHQLVWREVEDPIPQPGEALVSIHATTLNRADLSQAEGNYPPPPGAPHIMGLDMSGEILKLGPGVEGWQVGDQACALLAGGGYAEKVAVDQRLLIPIPPGWSFEEAACLPEVYLTAYVNIFMEAGFQAGETILIHGGASGVGTAAIQLAKGAGGRVITTAGRPDKVKACQDQGADLAVNYRTEDFVASTLEFTQGEGVDVILDMVGAEYLERNISLLKVKGRLVFIATLGGSEATVDIRQLMGKRARLIGSVLRARPVAEKAEIIRRFRQQFWGQIEEGSIRPVIDKVMPVADAHAAHERLRDYQNIGKIVLKVR
ncbi:MAG: NAD(P)H-quinone oxidoreductase [Caldilineaceae bacterium]|nr:NAD(P)H-quinone oxidoreductase [Caldilineaceae bacterium]